MSRAGDSASQTPAAFSRLQLAAALIEYDNDDTDPNAPRRLAKESAIFAPVRRQNPPRLPAISRRSTDYLSVPPEPDVGSVAARESIAETRRSRASTDALKNPFGRDSTYGDLDLPAENMEVDLASWGLDAFVPKEKGAKKQRNKGKGKEKEKEEDFPNPFPPSPTGPEPVRKRFESSRSASLGNLDGFGQGGAFLDAQSSLPVRRPSTRRHSIGTALELADAEPSEFYLQQRRGSAHDLIQSIPPTPPLHSIPFPTVGSVRSVSPVPIENSGNARRSTSASILDPHKRTQSTASMGSIGRFMLNDDEELPNPYAAGSPSPIRASQFDPKAIRGRTMSAGTLGTMAVQNQAEEPNPFEVRPPSPSRASRFDPKANDEARRSRTMSGGTQMMLMGDDDGSYMSRPPTRERMYSRLDLMRPKVLVMPSPLQQVAPPPPPAPTATLREGFTVTHASDGRPLPPGARTEGRSTIMASMIPSSSLEVPVASNAFIPNPRDNLTLSQLTFRNTLMVDGQRDPAYGDLEGDIQRATEDGEQVNLEPEPEPEPEPADEAEVPIVEEPIQKGRPPGKLFGKSLIDDLEARKVEMKSKQRVFWGDQRPSMMARTQIKRSSTLIDPAALKRPPSQHLNSFPPSAGGDLQRRNSANIKPLLNFDDEIPGARGQTLDLPHPGPMNTKSVFGVDTIWERELVKLREIEAREKAEEEERQRQEALEEGKKKKKGKRGKDKSKVTATSPALPVEPQPSPVPEPITERAPSPPHVLPAVSKVTSRRLPPPPNDDEDDDESDESDDSQSPPKRVTRKSTDDWHAGSSDEERGPRRMTGSGPRYPKARAPRQVDDGSSEEDVPLVATIGRAVERASRAQLTADDSDEEKPLSMFLDKTKLKLPSLGDKLFGDSNSKAGDDDEDEDDKPLGLRASRVIASTVGQDDEDERPLAFHPDQMRRTQFMMVQQQQQQQQQFMMQAHAAQMHQSMMFGAAPMAPMMTGGFFAPPMGGPMAPPMMMTGPIVPITPPPPNDTAKLGMIDNWRHDVAVQGQNPS